MAEFLTDGTNTFIGGQDASKFPDLLSADKYAAGVNITVENGCPTPRWGLDKKKLNIGDDGVDVGNNVIIPYSEIFRTGRYQHRAAYTIGPDYYILTVVAGIIYLFNIDTWETTILSLPNGDTLNENAPRLNGENADKYYVIHDWPNVPVIIEGITARRARRDEYEVPVSTMGAFNQNRLFIANAGSEITAGDPVGNLLTPKAPITFEEIEAPGAAFLGQIFSLPTNTLNAHITAMTFLEFTDTSTGIGPLLVATANQIFSYNSQDPRTTWETQQFGKALVSTGGIAGPRSFVHVGSDLFYFGNDGQVRTLSMSRDEQKKWARIPVSREVTNWLQYNDQALIPFTVMGLFRNKILVTVNPFRTHAFTRNRIPTFDVAMGGFAVLELDNLATISQNTPPTWPALWTGCRPMDVVLVNERFFVIAKDEDSVNSIYEFNTDTTYDTDGPNIRYATAVLYTKEYDFQSPFNLKALHSLDLGLRNIQGDFKIRVDYKPSHGSTFAHWQTFTHIAPWRSCLIPEGCAVNGLAGHAIRDITLGDPVDKGCNLVDNLTYDMLKKVQLKFTIEGKYWELREYLLRASAISQSAQVTSCLESVPVSICNQCNDDWKVGAFESCLSQRT